MRAIAVRVDRQLCMGHGRCSALVPEIFQVDEAGYCSQVELDLDEASWDRAKLAEANCPEGAITVQASERDR